MTRHDFTHLVVPALLGILILSLVSSWLIWSQLTTTVYLRSSCGVTNLAHQKPAWYKEEEK